MKYYIAIILHLLISQMIFAAPAPQTFTHTITSDGQSYQINFQKYSNRGPLFEVVVQQSNGSFVNYSPQESRTYIGYVDALPGAIAAATYRDNGEVLVRLTFENGFEWIDSNGSVTVEERDLTPYLPSYFLRSGGAGSTLYGIDLYMDLPSSYIADCGGTEDAALEMAEFSMMAINLIYFRDACVFNRIGRVVMRKDPAQDPYNGTNDSSTLLSTVGTEGNSWVRGSNPAEDHDLGFVTKRTIGASLAYVGTIGTGSSLNRSFANGDFTTAARHELGHNWGLSHYDGRIDGTVVVPGGTGNGSPEGKTINSGNGLAKMSAPEIERVLVERDRKIAVLTNLGNAAPAVPPRAADFLMERIVVPGGAEIDIFPLSNDSDSNGDSISILTVDSSSQNGATISIAPGNQHLKVNFPASYVFSDFDYFRYQIVDSTGRTSTAVVHMLIGSLATDVATWENPPTALNGSIITMEASRENMTDFALEYYFTNTTITDGSHDSGWQESPFYTDTGLTEGQIYSYTVQIRSKLNPSVTTTTSNVANAKTVTLSGQLFVDNFNRSSLNGSSGQSGLLAPLNYQTRLIGDSVVLDLLNDSLRIDGPALSGAYGAIAYLADYNFGSQAMHSLGGLRVSFDVSQYSTAGTGRYMSLGIGQSVKDIEDQVGVNPSSSSADLVVAYMKTTGKLEIYKNGVLDSSETVTGNLPVDPTTVTVEYFSNNYRAGSTATYSVYFDNSNTPFTSGTFTWSEDYKNYISLSSNLTENARFDNLSIEAIDGGGVSDLVLYSDTFSRANSSNLNASNDGKSGAIKNANYTAKITDSRVILDINNGALRVNGPAASGSYGGLVYLNDHNFIDTDIIVAGGFSVSTDISQYSTAGSSRQMAIAVGQSLNDLDSQNGVAPNDYAADLYVGYRYKTGALEIYKNGVLDTSETVLSGLPAPPTTMRIDYFLNDFNAGSTVSYNIFFDDSAIPFTSGSFNWSATNENYISLSSNLTSNSLFDNFEVRTKAESGHLNDFQDYALSGAASQSSTILNGIPAKAIDGNTSGVWNAVPSSVTHTANQPQPWWELDLGANYDVGMIKVYGRTDSCCIERLSDYDIFILDSDRNIVWSSYQANAPEPSVLVNANGAAGRYVKVQLRGTNPLSLAEVLVYRNLPSGTTAVPILIGSSLSTALDDIATANLEVGSVTSVYSSTVPIGEVISLSTSENVLLPTGSIIDLVVSQGSVPTPKLVRTTINSVTNLGWTTVDLGQNYDSAVIIATPIYPNGTISPVVTRIRNVSGSSFDLRLGRVDGLTNQVSLSVSVVAVEEGVYTQAENGVKMEAVKITSSVTAHNSSWTAEAQSYSNSYTSPVVVGQVMSVNDPLWSVFWSMGSTRTSPATASSFAVGKHVGEDSDITRADEVIGYIVIESGSGSISGIAYEAALGSDTVQGTANSSTPYQYSLMGGLSQANVAAASISGMDGSDGAWAVLAGNPALTTSNIGLYAIEDQLNDTEASHTTTQVGYIIFE